MKKLIQTTLLLAAVSITLSAQNSTSDVSFQLSGGPSVVFNTGSMGFFTSNVYPVADFEVAYATRPSNSGKFAQAYNYPSFGFGITWSGLGTMAYTNDSYLSDLWSFYGFFERDIIRTRSFSFGYDLGLGFGLTRSQYDPVDNASNTLFGSSLLFYVAMGPYVKWRPVDHLEIGLSSDFRHHSFGRLAFPNYGLNELIPRLSVRYSVDAPYVQKTGFTAREDFRRGFEYDLSVGGGIHHCSTEWNAFHGPGVKPQYGHDKTSGWEKYCANVSVYYRYAMKFSSGIGFDAFWTSWEFMDMLKSCDTAKYGAKAVSESPGYNPFSCGLSAMQNFHYGGFSFFAGVGCYLFKHYGIDEQLSRCYQKIGFKYRFEKLAGMYLALDCKTHYFSRAEMMEFCVGFRI